MFLTFSVRLGVESRAGLNDNVPDRPSAKVTPVGCQLATMALESKTVTVPEGGLHGKKLVTPSGTSVHLG